MSTPKPTDLSSILSSLLYTEQIDHLYQDMKKLVNSFSAATETAEADALARSKFTDERNLICLSNLQSISECIDTLRSLEPSLDYSLGKFADVEEMDSTGEIVEEPVMGGEEEHETETKSKSTATIEVEDFDAYRSSWELLRRPAKIFEDMTLLSPMVFTHCTPGHIPRDAIVGSSLQIYSIRVAELHQVEGADLSWPMEVYGVVAARDTVDNSRNPIFLRPRHNCQMLTLQDPFLHLMGPSRAILSVDPVIIEIQLKVKGRAKSEDRNLISKVCHCNGECFGTFLVRDNLCAIELCCEQVKKSVQATVSRARVVEQGSLPSHYGGRVLCCSLPEGAIKDDSTDQSNQIVMLDSKNGTVPMGKHHCFNLSRSVVAVELKGRLKVAIEAYAPSGTISGHALFTPQKCNITKGICYLGDSAVELTVAWSLLPLSKANPRSKEEIDQMEKLSNIMGKMSSEASMLRKMSLDTLQIDGDFDIEEEQLPSRIIIGGVDTGEEAEEVVGVPTATGEDVEVETDEDDKAVMIDEKVEAPNDMDFTLSPYADLVCFLQDQMQKLVEPSFFSMEGNEIVSFWSGSEQIMRSMTKLVSVSAQIDELGKLIPDLNKKLSLICSKSSEYSSTEAENEEELFAGHRHMWELFNSNKFEELTSLSSMIFTHCAPGCMPHYAVVKPTLQILSIKVTEVTDLERPLKVYGIIAARDTVDNLRNPLFLCPRNDGQLVTQHDPFLRLTGPSRAVVCEDPVLFEIQLKLKGRIESEDKVLISTKLSYKRDSADRLSTLNIGNHFCKMEFRCQKLEKSVQATIVGVRVVDQRPSSFLDGVQVLCTSLPRGFEDDDTLLSCPDLLVHDSRDGIRSMDGHLDLRRHVVSAELRGKLRILIKDCKFGGITGHVLFSPKKCNFSQATCLVGDAEVEITVAWSMHVENDECILSSSYVDPFELLKDAHRYIPPC